MARIYRTTDRIKVKIDDVTLLLSPLNLQQKTEVQTAMLAGRNKNDVKEATRGIALAMKYSIKGIDGVEDENGPYVLRLEDNALNDECVSDLLNLEISNKMALVCSSLANGIPKSFADIEGVEIVKQLRVDEVPKN